MTDQHVALVLNGDKADTHGSSSACCCTCATAACSCILGSSIWNSVEVVPVPESWAVQLGPNEAIHLFSASCGTEHYLIAMFQLAWASDQDKLQFKLDAESRGAQVMCDEHGTMIEVTRLAQEPAASTHNPDGAAAMGHSSCRIQRVTSATSNSASESSACHSECSSTGGPCLSFIHALEERWMAVMDKADADMHSAAAGTLPDNHSTDFGLWSDNGLKGKSVQKPLPGFEHIPPQQQQLQLQLLHGPKLNQRLSCSSGDLTDRHLLQLQELLHQPAGVQSTLQQPQQPAEQQQQPVLQPQHAILSAAACNAGGQETLPPAQQQVPPLRHYHWGACAAFQSQFPTAPPQTPEPSAVVLTHHFQPLVPSVAASSRACQPFAKALGDIRLAFTFRHLLRQQAVMIPQLLQRCRMSVLSGVEALLPNRAYNNVRRCVCAKQRKAEAAAVCLLAHMLMLDAPKTLGTANVV